MEMQDSGAATISKLIGHFVQKERADCWIVQLINLADPSNFSVQLMGEDLLDPNPY